LPGVEADVVVVAAVGEEQRPRIRPHHHVHPELAAVERLRRRQVAHLEVDVAHRRAVRHRGRRFVAARFGQQALEVERQRRHLDLVAGPAPLLARAVAVELDSVALGVAQVERLADQVVGRPGEAPARVGHAAQRAREVGPARHEQREVEEAGGASRTRRRVGRRQQLDQRLALEAHRDDAVIAVELAQPDNALVEGRERRLVRHAQPHGARCE
jgi:hypothetical protein